MENQLLDRLHRRLGVPPEAVDPIWLLTLLSVLEVGRYSLEEWNGALSLALGRRICCPSYGSLSRYLHQAVLDVK